MILSNIKTKQNNFYKKQNIQAIKREIETFYVHLFIKKNLFNKKSFKLVDLNYFLKHEISTTANSSRSLMMERNIESIEYNYTLKSIDIMDAIGK
ncbi:hypothetical protein BpHYR1_018005 [Brachionus plicatilis]|uniref:Uncharacterized protein n=1 Tax=Brachionus plicatilis TaxID=10195 RepID=A0A3M7PF81_BRAPC|nr:hypothetical protein BpHYR1_018005 [Brachionus plicatilis]